jgi:diguanylate cyclase (GGDEF)-like protein
MISIKRSVDQIDSVRTLCDAQLACLRSVVHDIGQYVVPACSPQPEQHAQCLDDLGRRLAAADPAVLALFRMELSELLKSLHQAAADAYRGKAAEIRQILEVLAEAAERFSSRSDTYAGRFRDFANALDKVQKMDSLGDIRSALATHTVSLRSCVSEMERDNNSLVQKLTAEVSQARALLKQAQNAALEDSLTGMGNRRALEQHIRGLIEADQGFSIGLFEVDNFTGLKGRFGPTSGDAILRQFAERLRGQLRPGDVACRWTGEEFVVVLDCRMKDVFALARHMAQALSGRYTVASDGRELKADVSVSAGVAEYRRGESVDNLLERADALLQHRRCEHRPPN